MQKLNTIRLDSYLAFEEFASGDYTYTEIDGHEILVARADDGTVSALYYKSAGFGSRRASGLKTDDPVAFSEYDSLYPYA